MRGFVGRSFGVVGAVVIAVGIVIAALWWVGRAGAAWMGFSSSDFPFWLILAFGFGSAMMGLFVASMAVLAFSFVGWAIEKVTPEELKPKAKADAFDVKRIVVVPSAGIYIGTCLSAAKEIANLNGVPVEFEFNGRSYEVKPGQTDKELFEMNPISREEA